jgi:hypothetical protein
MSPREHWDEPVAWIVQGSTGYGLVAWIGPREH